MWWQRRRKRDRDWERELRSHLDAEAEEQRSLGLPECDAQAAAKRTFGNLALVTEDVRETWGWMWLERFAQDVRYGLRRLRKERGFAALAILALALGIAATTVVFSVVDNVLLEPFPYKASERLTKFYIRDMAHPDQTGRADFLLAEYRAFRDQNHVFEDMIASRSVDVLVSDSEGLRQFPGYEMSANSFEFFGVQPLMGRSMSVTDGDANAPPVTVLSYRAWRSAFGSDPGIVGKLVTLNGQQVTVLGVMPPRFQLYDGDFWLPLRVTDDHVVVNTMARVRPGITMQAAASDLDAIARRLASTYPEIYPPKFNVTAITLLDRVVRRFRPLLYALMAAVGMLLLIACSNVANLLLARATAREQEIAIRASLGASRARLIAQLMVESFLLAAFGCAIGCAAAYGGIRGIAATLPRDLFPNEAVIRLNGRVLGFAAAMAVVTTFVSGLAPAVHAVGRNLYERATAIGKGSGTVARHGRLRSSLVVLQVALSIVLLVGAGLLMRSLLAVQNVDLGFKPDRLLAVRLPLPRGRYDTADQKSVFFRAVLQRISALPGVTSAATVIAVPPSGGPRSDVTILGDTSQQKRRSGIQLCSESYFNTVGIRLLRGRLLTEEDVNAARRVIVVNGTLARTFFGQKDAIGQAIKFNFFDRIPEGPADAYFEIVGVVADVRNNGLEEPAAPESFLPYTVTAAGGRGVLVRTAVDPYSLVADIKREVRAVEPGVAFTPVSSLETMLEQNVYAQPRFAAVVMSAFAGIGLLLAAIGIFSVMAYAVSLRTHEFGIRMALGAQRGAVLRIVLWRGMAMIAAGVVMGEVTSVVLIRLLRTQLWGVSPYDPLTLASVVAVLAVAGGIACLVPARRATHVDPMVALRYE